MRDVRMTPYLNFRAIYKNSRGAVGSESTGLSADSSGKVSAPLRAPNTYACCNTPIKIVCEDSTSQICSVNDDPLCSSE